jgi:hypothetical protein
LATQDRDVIFRYKEINKVKIMKNYTLIIEKKHLKYWENEQEHIQDLVAIPKNMLVEIKFKTEFPEIMYFIGQKTMIGGN